MKFYTIKLPKFLGGLVRAMLGTFKKGLTDRSFRGKLYRIHDHFHLNIHHYNKNDCTHNNGCFYLCIVRKLNNLVIKTIKKESAYQPIPFISNFELKFREDAQNSLYAFYFT